MSAGSHDTDGQHGTGGTGRRLSAACTLEGDALGEIAASSEADLDRAIRGLEYAVELAELVGSARTHDTFFRAAVAAGAAAQVATKYALQLAALAERFATLASVSRHVSGEDDQS